MGVSNKDCPLCRTTDKLSSVKGMDERQYNLCQTCYLISVDREDLPDKQTEKERYLTHNNGIEHEGYVTFLRQAIDPALKYISKDMVGLDYGCGPGPTLSKLLGNEGYTCEDYDPFFVKHDLDKKFGFIFSTEAFEHFFYPDKEIEKIWSLLEDNGIVVVMTERWQNVDQFSKWYYTRDNSHVCFYHLRTFDHICEHLRFEKIFDDEQRVVILKKKSM